MSIVSHTSSRYSILFPWIFDTFCLSHGLVWDMLQPLLDTYNWLRKPSCQPVGRKWEQSKDPILGIVLCAATNGCLNGFDLVNQGMIDNGQIRTDVHHDICSVCSVFIDCSRGHLDIMPRAIPCVSNNIL